jgi:DNA-binding transcriptional MerR regulator
MNMIKDCRYKLLIKLVVLMAPLLNLSVGLAGGQDMVNCLVARVNSIPVSWFDLKVMESFGLLSNSGEVPLSTEERLDLYIDRLLVLRLAREQLQVSQEEIKTELNHLRNRLGSEMLEKKCQALGMKETDLVSYLQDKILFEKVIRTRFNQKLYVSLKEIEDYYEQVYVPEQEAEGKTPPELVAVLDEIEARLQNQRRQQQVKDWTRELRQRAEITIYSDCLNKIKEQG